MKENKMPDIIWCGMTFVGGPFWSPKCTHHKKDEKYLRAERVEELLKQARDALVKGKSYYKLFASPEGYDEAIKSIDEFLGYEK